MKFLTLACSCLALAAFTLLLSAFQQPTASNRSDTSAGWITTLYQNDPLQYALDLRTGQPGLVVQDGEVRNRDSHVSLGYYPDSLTVAIQGGDTGAIVDLGTFQELGKRNSIPRIGNGGNVYVALDFPWVSAHSGLQETRSVAHAAIQPGHVYVVRIVKDREPDLLAKLLVLDFRPGESVTLRWQRIEE